MKILIDCDPGHDDMVAILLACASPQLEVLGVTTVAGNQTGEKTWGNARRILTLIGRQDIPAARGADRPLLREPIVAPEIHGVSGLDGAELPAPGFPGLPGHAVDFLIRTILGSREPVTLVPTGPLTNVALALRQAPELARRLRAHRAHGRGGARLQRHPGGGVQHLRGPGGRAHRVRERGPDRHGRPGRDQPGAPLLRGHRRDWPPGTGRSPGCWRRCCVFSPGPTGRCSASTARPCTTPWPWPICCGPR